MTFASAAAARRATPDGGVRVSEGPAPQPLRIRPFPARPAKVKPVSLQGEGLVLARALGRRGSERVLPALRSAEEAAGSQRASPALPARAEAVDARRSSAVGA